MKESENQDPTTLAPLSTAELAVLAAGLPPRIESSAEDIAARLAARRARVSDDVREPNQSTDDTTHYASSTPSPADQVACNGADDPEERCPRHPSECTCWKVDNDHPMRKTASPASEVEGCHPTHSTRSSDASSFDEVCTACGATDIAGGGWGKLAEPCSAHTPKLTGRPNQTCGNCHFHAMNSATICRRYPSRAGDDHFYVAADSWCGEWKPIATSGAAHE